MKIVFIGSVEFSKLALKKIIDCNANVVGVCTKKYSSFNSDFADLTPECKNAKIPIKYVKNINDKESIEWIKKLNPDLIFCFGWSFLIKDELLNLPRMGIVGYHPAELPKNRGRHPLIWALFLGLNSTASTFFFMDNGADTGDILSQVKVNIDREDNARSLYDKITETALLQIEKFIPELESGNYLRKPQDHSLANSWRKRGELDGKIDFRMSSQAIHRLVKALTEPYIGAHVQWRNTDIKVWSTKEVSCKLDNHEPGKILSIENNRIVVKTYDSAIMLIKHNFKIMPTVGEYL